MAETMSGYGEPDRLVANTLRMLAADAVHEAGITLGRSRYVGERGGFLGLDRFEALAPHKVLFEQFGFCVDNVVKQVHTLVALGSSRRWSAADLDSHRSMM